MEPLNRKYSLRILVKKSSTHSISLRSILLKVFVNSPVWIHSTSYAYLGIDKRLLTLLDEDLMTIEEPVLDCVDKDVVLPSGSVVA